MYRTLHLQSGHGVVSITLNRPTVRNAFNAEMIAELRDVFEGVARNSDVRVVVLRGEGKVFSAGADVNWMRSSLDFTWEDNVLDATQMSDMYASIRAAPVPVIARVHGAALGGGMGLLAASDIVISADDAIFGFTETKLGIIPAVVSRVVFPKIAPGWISALYVTGERFGADVARHIGLVHWIADPDELDTVVESKVKEVLGGGPRAVAAAKRLVREAAHLQDQDLRSYTAERIAEVRASDEGQEGLRAFLDKRQPSWRRET